jgi:membrane protein YqaA with SNARE-associated domain
MSVLTLTLTTLGVCFASGFIPLINAEVYLLGAALLAPSEAALPLILAGTAGQMAAKTVLFFATRRMGHRATGRIGEQLARAQTYLERWRGKTEWMVFVSALTGIPPFYAISVLSGVIRNFPFWQFAVLSTIGRFIRFAAVVLFPNAIQAYL